MSNNERAHQVSDLDENTTAGELRELANSDDELIRMAVTQNANTPPDVLIKLFSEFPYLVLSHPLLDFLLLETPNFFYKLCQDNTHVFYDNELPLFFIEWAARSSDIYIRRALASYKFLPEYIIDKLLLDEVDIRENLAYNDFLPLHTIEKLAKDENEYIRMIIAGRNDLSRHLSEILAKDESDAVKCKLAENPNTPSEILETLSSCEDYSILKAIAKNKNSPDNVLLSLFTEFPYIVLKSISEHNTNLLGEFFEKYPNIFKIRNLPYFVIDWAIKNCDTSTKIAVLRGNNPIDACHLTQLSLEESSEIRRLVASQKRATIQILLNLSKDQENEVRLAVAANQNTSADILELLSSDTVDNIRELVAAHPNTPLPILKQIAFFDRAEKVRFAVIKNQNRSKEILQILSNDRSFQVRRAANYYLQRLQKVT